MLRIMRNIGQAYIARFSVGTASVMARAASKMAVGLRYSILKINLEVTAYRMVKIQVIDRMRSTLEVYFLLTTASGHTSVFNWIFCHQVKYHRSFLGGVIELLLYVRGDFCYKCCLSSLDIPYSSFYLWRPRTPYSTNRNPLE